MGSTRQVTVCPGAFCVHAVVGCVQCVQKADLSLSSCVAMLWYGNDSSLQRLPVIPHLNSIEPCPGMRGKTLIINLPGKPKSIRETFDEVFRSIPYCIQVITNHY